MPMIEEILLGLATSGSGMLPLGEQQLLDLASGNTPLSSSLYDLVGEQIDTTNLSKPHAYLVYTMFDAKMNLIEESSGVLQVEDPNERKTLDALDLHVPKGGYLHTYVTNSGTQKVNFDKFTVLRLQGKTREIFHYYPYGLEIHGINATQRKYKYRYSGKELQTAEWGKDGHGIELHDFGSRFYQATTGRWHVPDPAEQFHNPYLGIGNNPVVYTDPDGEWVNVAGQIAFQAVLSGLSAEHEGGKFADGFIQGAFQSAFNIATSTVANYAFANSSGVGNHLAYSATQGIGGGVSSHLSGGNFSFGFSQSFTLSSFSNTVSLSEPEILNDNYKPENGGVLLPVADVEWNGNYGSGRFTHDTFSWLSEKYYQAENYLVNPTGFGIRNDTEGLGHWGADRGNRSHRGIDFKSEVGQSVVSPINGKVRNFIGASTNYPMLQIYPADNRADFDYIQMLYVDAPEGATYWEWRNVSAGDVVGNAANLQQWYSDGVTPHIHLTIWDGGTRINPTPFFNLAP